MGKQDTITKDYMSDPEHFADAFNFYLYNGGQFIRPSNLSVDDPTELGVIFNENNKEVVQKARDILKQCVFMKDEKYCYLILGIENQTDVHYAMPVKNMIYDALNYGQQVTEKAKLHREKKDIQGAEFLSGFSKEDKIKPVITLVVYFGTDTWDAPRSLKEMFEDESEEILQHVSDYKLNIIIPKEIEDFSKFKTDFGKAMKYISVADNERLYNQVANEETYKEISIETARLLNECIGMKIPITGKEETHVKVCKAVRDIEENAKMAGMLEGVTILVSTLQELGQTNEFILKTIVEKFSMSEEEAEKYIK